MAEKTFDGALQTYFKYFIVVTDSLKYVLMLKCFFFFKWTFNTMISLQGVAYARLFSNQLI